jgi:phosphoribosylaminoimidazole-succinocarboxamide synthase
MGSVKDIRILKQAQADKTGIADFKFSDRYSVFDWGEMPDHIPDKGKALCIIGAFFFEKLEAMNIKTHYLGVVENGKLKKLHDVKNVVDTMQVKLVRVIRPEIEHGIYNYSQFKNVKGNFLIPLELIYRNTLPAGSSIFKRLKNGTLSLADIGLNQMPQPNDILEKPILDASTKLEVIDRYVSWGEAQEISALSDKEIEDIKNTILRINQLITKQCARVGIRNEDGKAEMAFDEQRNLMVVDVLGTPDECRFNYHGMQVSKEVARIYYRKTSWFAEIEKRKKQDPIEWKKLVNNPAPNLPYEFLVLISRIYQSYCNEITGREWFRTPPLKNVLQEIETFLKI